MPGVYHRPPKKTRQKVRQTASNVQGGFTGEGNINTNPLFVDAANDNLRLLPGSPCIDAADNGAPGVGAIATDVDSHARFADDPATVDTENTPKAIVPIIDMGPYEYIAGDGDRDGDTDLFDYELFAGCATGPGGGVPAGCIFLDMDADGDVDLIDFAVFQIAFTGSP